MYRIRFHGRGGQGMKTASRLLGTALFLEGFQVQDAPRYGAERRGAPIFAYVRAARAPIHERGVIRRPDLVLVADDTLVSVPAAGVLAGVDAGTVLVVCSELPPAQWRHRLTLEAPVLTLPVPEGEEDPLAQRYVGARCAGAAARLTGLVARTALEEALRQEIGALGEEALARSRDAALDGFDAMATHEGCVREGPEPDAADYQAPDWVEIPFDDARISAPSIHGGLTSVEVRTGLWRTMRPVVDTGRCNRCWWVCSSLCPDSAIDVGEDGYPRVDYDHCKGCMICVAQCPAHAIHVVPEARAGADHRGVAETSA
jgi:pyruvate ferredoxin oxidoreductase gamma subunit